MKLFVDDSLFVQEHLSAVDMCWLWQSIAGEQLENFDTNNMIWHITCEDGLQHISWWNRRSYLKRKKLIFAINIYIFIINIINIADCPTVKYNMILFYALCP